MSFSSMSRSENNTNTEAPDFIDLKEFSNRCAILKNDIKLSKNCTSTLDLNVNDDEESLAAINPSLVEKWQKIFEENSLIDKDALDHLIKTEDASLSNESAKKEAYFARRIAKSKLAAIEAYKIDSSSLLNSKCNSKSSTLFPALPNSLTTTKCPTYKSETENVTEPVSSDDVIISFSVYPGGKSSLLHSSHKQEIEIKASDSLSSLTEEIYCLSRRAAGDLIAGTFNSEIIKSSSFLFIEGVFYDDELDENSHARPSDIYYEAFKTVGNTSSTAHSLCSNPASVQRASLKSTKWLDLKVRLNTPYLFVHLGGCEHVLVINQIRAANPVDENNLVLPHITQALRVRRRKCRVCEVYAGTKMLINDKLMPENPCVICEKCYEGFHGSGKEWYQDFEVVPYYHEA